MTGDRTSTTVYRFGACEVRPTERQLLVAGQLATLGSRAFDVLLALIERRGQLARRAELIDAAWPGLVVEENNLSVQVAALRRLLGAEAIVTIPGLGYQFAAELREADRVEPTAAGQPGGPFEASVRLRDREEGADGLIGRDADIAAVQDLLEAHRLVTVTGAGGIGKSRLARAVASRRRPGVVGPAKLVELAPVSDPELLASSVATALGLRLPGLQPPLDEVSDELHNIQVLVILDNCEHLIEAASRFVQRILASTSMVRILVTSQELLKLPVEQVYRLDPLAVPPADEADPCGYPAMQLLAECVRRLDRRFVLDASRWEDAAEVCRRLDGLPLALELAAARVPMLGLAGVRDGLNERFRLLAGDSRAGLRRHRALRETIGWSHALLSPAEAQAFARAGAFAGSFGLDQARQVLSMGEGDGWTVLDALSGLVDKSLVLIDRTDPPRYRLLESTREFARQSLSACGEAVAVQRRHALAMLDLFEQMVALPWALPSQERLRRVLPDLDNVRTALDWSYHAEPTLYLRLTAVTAWLFGAIGQTQEGLLRVNHALARVDKTTPHDVEARLQLELSGLHHGSAGTSKLAAARRAVTLLERCDDLQARFAGWGRLAITASLCGDAAGLGAQALAAMQALWQPGWPPLARWDLLNAEDYVTNLRSDLSEAQRVEQGERLAREQLTLARAEGDTVRTLFALMAAEQCAATRERYEEAVDRGRELVALAQNETYVERLHIYICNLATALVMANRAEEALPLARRSAAIDARHGSLWESLDMLAMLAYRRGRLEAAARIVGRADAANAWRGADFRQEVERKVRQAVVDALARHLPAATLRALADAGAALSDEAAASLALDGDDGPWQTAT